MLGKSLTFLFQFNVIALALLLALLLGCNAESASIEKGNDYLPSSWSSAEVIPLCDPQGEKTGASLIAIENSGKAYFNKKVKRSQNEISVSFDFLSDCCLEFDIWYVIEEDILKIKYQPKKDQLPCDCKCDYRGMVNIGDTEKDLSSIYRVSIKRGK